MVCPLYPMAGLRHVGNNLQPNIIYRRSFLITYNNVCFTIVDVYIFIISWTCCGVNKINVLFLYCGVGELRLLLSDDCTMWTGSYSLTLSECHIWRGTWLVHITRRIMLNFNKTNFWVTINCRCWNCQGSGNVRPPEQHRWRRDSGSMRQMDGCPCWVVPLLLHMNHL